MSEEDQTYHYILKDAAGDAKDYLEGLYEIKRLGLGQKEALEYLIKTAREGREYLKCLAEDYK